MAIHSLGKLWLAAALIGACIMISSDAVAQLQQNGMPEPAPTPGATGFRVCNKTSTQLEVAKALNTSTSGQPVNFISEGWYKVDPGQCILLWAGKLEYRYYLLYAQNKQTQREWKGNIAVCVNQQPFKIEHGYCEPASYQRRFFQVDTGESESWTQNFTD